MNENYYQALLRLEREALRNFYGWPKLQADQRLIQERIERDGQNG